MLPHDTVHVTPKTNEPSRKWFKHQPIAKSNNKDWQPSGEDAVQVHSENAAAEIGAKHQNKTILCLRLSTLVHWDEALRCIDQKKKK